MYNYLSLHFNFRGLTIMELSEQEIIRRNSLQELINLGIDPYPAAKYEISATSKEILENFDAEKGNYQGISFAGRITGKRIMGKASFVELQDSTGKLQVYVNRDLICPDDDKTMYNTVFKKLLDIGVENPLVDPKITIYRNVFDGNGPQLIHEKNDWVDEENTEEIIETINKFGAFPLWPVSNFQGMEMPTNDVTSVASVLTLDSGVYTIIAEGNDGSSGEILLEVYEINEI